MTHLAQFSSFSKQGEVLCTRSLEYLLENSDAKRAFSKLLTSLFGVDVSPDLRWRAEVAQIDGTRPDLEAYAADGKPLVKIEAKLGAQFGEGQLRSYAADLQRRAGGGMLLVLVPRYRIEEANKLVLTTFGLDKAICAVKVVSWDDVIEQFRCVTSEPFDGDLAQFSALYRALIGDDMEPLTNNDAIREWRKREGVFINYVDYATRDLTQQNTLMPMALDTRPRSLSSASPLPAQTVPAQGYLRRYVCRPIGAEQPCFSVGVRDPFEGYDTPVWLRFHKGTPLFSMIRDHLRASDLTLVEKNDGHVWIPLDVQLNADRNAVVASLVAQAEHIFTIARGTSVT